MKKGFIFLLSILFLAACSANGENAGKNENNDETAAEDASIEKEVLFSQEMEDNGDYDITGLKMDAEGQNVLFKVLEDIDRAEDKYTYMIDQNDELSKISDLAEDGDPDIGCTDLKFSPNGNYFVYNCHEDGIDFTVYDLEKEEIVDQIPKEGLFSVDVKHISNNMAVFAISEDDDGYSQLSIFDIEKDTREDYVLDELTGQENTELNTVIPTHDGKKMLLNTYKELYLFDIDTEEIEEIDDAEPYDEEYDADFFIYNTKLSADGKYAYYEISENKKDPKFRQHILQNFAEDKVTTFEEFDYKGARSLDENGNVLLEGEDEVHLYNMDTEETRIIPEIEPDMSVRNFKLSADGKHLFYTENSMMDDDTWELTLYRVLLDDVDAFETTDILAEHEKESADVGEDGIVLTENDSFNEKEKFQDLWDSSVDPMYPTDFPEKVAFKSQRFSQDKRDRSYSQTIYLDLEQPTDHAIEVRAKPNENLEQCLYEDDLEKADTIDGNDFYFHKYSNDDVEAGIEMDDFCYSIEAEDLSQDDLYKVAKSLEPIEDPVHEISMDNLEFPTKFPSKDPEERVSKISSFKSDDQMSYSVGYASEEDITLKLEISYLEPNGYDVKSSTKEDVSGFEEAYFWEKNPALNLYDGDHYYNLKFSLSTDEEQAYGIDEIKEALIEIAESMEK